MTRTRTLALVACVAALGLSCGRLPAPVGPEPVDPGQPRPAVEPPGPPEKAGPLIEFPRAPLASFGNTRFQIDGPIGSLALSPDGTVLAVAGRWDPGVRLWDTVTGREISRIALPGAEPWAKVKAPNSFGVHAAVVGYTSDGRLLVVQRRGDILVYDPDTGEKKAEIPMAAWGGVALSPDGRTLLGWPAGRLTLWATDTGKVQRDLGRVEGYNCRGLAVSPDGKQVAAYMNRDRTSVLVVAPADGSAPPEVRYTVGYSTSSSVAVGLFWPRADRVLLRTNEHHVVVDPTTGKEVVHKPWTDGTELLSGMLAVRGRMYATAHPGTRLFELDLDTLARTPCAGPRGSSFMNSGAVVSADGKRIAFPDAHTARVYDLATGKSLHPDIDALPSAPPRRLSFTHDGRRVIASGYEDFRIWDPATGKSQVLEHPYPKDILFAPSIFSSPDGRWLVAADPASLRRLAVWDATTGKVVFREPEEPDNAARDFDKRDGTGLLGFDASGAAVAFHRRSGDIVFFELPSGRVVRTIAGIPHTATARLSADGRRVAVAGDTFLAVRDVEPKSEWRDIDRHKRPEGGPKLYTVPLGFTHDGRRLVVQDEIGGLAVWDVTGEPAVIARRSGPVAAERDLAIEMPPGGVVTPDGRLIRPAPLADGRIGMRVLELATLREEFRVAPPGAWPRYAFSSDGRRLVLAHSDVTFTVWDWDVVMAGAGK